MPVSCSAYGCASRFVKDSGVQFFSFPLNDPDRLKLWLIAIKRKYWNPTKSSRICSKHFTASDYLERPGINFPRLKDSAVPSVFPDFEKHLQKNIQTGKSSRKRKFEDV